jgi:hypothetical protein
MPDYQPRRSDNPASLFLHKYIKYVRPAYPDICRHIITSIPVVPAYPISNRDIPISRYSYIPARPLLCQTGIKSTTVLVSFYSLDPTGGHPLDTTTKNMMDHRNPSHGYQTTYKLSKYSGAPRQKQCKAYIYT